MERRRVGTWKQTHAVEMFSQARRRNRPLICTSLAGSVDCASPTATETGRIRLTSKKHHRITLLPKLCQNGKDTAQRRSPMIRELDLSRRQNSRLATEILYGHTSGKRSFLPKRTSLIYHLGMFTLSDNTCIQC